MVSVRLCRRAPVIELAVSDTGIGISAGAQSHIFERFIRIDSRDGQGTSVIVELPVEAV
ncbi:hypothetical protein SPV1_03253 [Mariprofundus ferrooxydans PV-1]|uniref:Histidine kinase n=2 Tax=Mariprofundus ferrooxydans TaxID=314344 RepID=Q0EXM6_9PROT|nr:hypothetical protein SPV1_03253 [Mariprofundus ferrooxydans PV-1]